MLRLCGKHVRNSITVLQPPFPLEYARMSGAFKPAYAPIFNLP